MTSLPVDELLQEDLLSHIRNIALLYEKWKTNSDRNVYVELILNSNKLLEYLEPLDSKNILVAFVSLIKLNRLEYSVYQKFAIAFNSIVLDDISAVKNKKTVPNDNLYRASAKIAAMTTAYIMLLEKTQKITPINIKQLYTNLYPFEYLNENQIYNSVIGNDMYLENFLALHNNEQVRNINSIVVRKFDRTNDFNFSPVISEIQQFIKDVNKNNS